MSVYAVAIRYAEPKCIEWITIANVAQPYKQRVYTPNCLMDRGRWGHHRAARLTNGNRDFRFLSPPSFHALLSTRYQVGGAFMHSTLCTTGSP